MANAAANGERLIDIMISNNLEMMDDYLKRGGNVDVIIEENYATTPLCSARSVEMVKLLLENGANIRFRDEKRRRTPLLWQALSGDHNSPEIIKFLLKKDPTILYDVDIYGENALHLCVILAYEPSLQCAKFLLAVDPTLVTMKNKLGQTPLYNAYQSSSVATERIKELLISAKEMLNKNPALLDRTPEQRMAITKASLKIALFTNTHAETARSLPWWKPSKNNYSVGGSSFEKLRRTKRHNSTPAPPSTPTGERKSRKRTRKSKNRKNKSRKSRRY
jgi:hypothetical protein